MFLVALSSNWSMQWAESLFKSGMRSELTLIFISCFWRSCTLYSRVDSISSIFSCAWSFTFSLVSLNIPTQAALASLVIYSSPFFVSVNFNSSIGKNSNTYLILFSQPSTETPLALTIVSMVESLSSRRLLTNSII